MGCDWIEWDKNFPDKPEVLALMELSGATLDECTGRMSRFWAWVDDHVGKDANLPFVSYAAMAQKFGGDVKFWESLTCHAVRWLAQKDGAFVIPNWKKRFSGGAKMRANAARRQSRKRRRDNDKRPKKRVTPVSHNGVTEALPTGQYRTVPDRTGQDITNTGLAGACAGEGKAAKMPSVFDSVTDSTLRDDSQVDAWHRMASAKRKPIVSASDRDRLFVFAAAARALDRSCPKPADNPAALFAWIVSGDHRTRPTEDHYESARRRLSALDEARRYGDRLPRAGPAVDDEAELVRAKQEAMKALEATSR